VNPLSFLKRLFRRSGEIASKKPVGKFKVDSVLDDGAISGEVLDGIIYSGYKLKPKGKKIVVPIMKIMRGKEEIEFAIEYDRVILLPEDKLKVEEGEILEVYAS